MNSAIRQRGPWFHRVLIWGFTVLFGVLCFWLTDFFLDDIENLPGPEYGDVESEMLDGDPAAEVAGLAEQIDANSRAIERETKRQRLLQDSTQEAQRTMSQLLDFQKLAIDKGVTPSPEEQKALADSQRIFLENQQRYQERSQEVTRLEEQRDTLEASRRDATARLAARRAPVYEEFDRRLEQHRWKIAGLKLAVLLPLLLAAAVLFIKLRPTLYAPLSYAFGAAIAAQVSLVMHEYFPSEVFKYLLIGVAIVAVVRILVYLIRLVAHPKADWLVRQYREAYERFLCPVCEFPIRRGPLKYVLWTRRNQKNLPAMPPPSATKDIEEPYTCPLCAVQLFHECPVCKNQRHALLPACEHCGTTKSLEEIAAATAKS